MRDVGDVRLAMNGVFDSGIHASLDEDTVVRLQFWQKPIPAVMAGLGIAAVAGLAVWTMTRPEPMPALDLARLAIVPPDTAPLDLGGPANDVAISPDGTRVIHQSGPRGARQLNVRPIDRLDSTPLRGVVNGFGPFFSPDGQWVGFTTEGSGTVLQRVSILGGPPVTLTRSTGGAILGASWAEDQIVFGTRDSGLFRVSAGGGDPVPLTTPRAPERHSWPFIIASRGAVVFVAGEGDNQVSTGRLAVIDLATREVADLGLLGISPHYVASGHLVYAVDDGSVRAVPFDVASLEVVGNPVPLVEGVRVKISGGADFDISENGHLVYALGQSQGDVRRSLVWHGRDGQTEPIPVPDGSYAYPRLSPDGSRVALDARGDDEGIWIWDFEQETRTRLSVDGGAFYPVWSPDGGHLAYESGGSFWRKASNNTGASELLATLSERESTVRPNPYFFTPDSSALVVRQIRPGNDDLHMISLADPTAPVWSLASDFNERNAELSPNGRWLAYQSDESGEYQVYVRPPNRRRRLAPDI